METREEKSCGVVPVFKKPDSSFVVCIIRHEQAHWGFPKGRQNVGETDMETAIRELEEETGITKIDFSNGKSFLEKYSFSDRETLCKKQVTYFLGFVPSMFAMTPDEFKKEISEFRWVSYEEARETLSFIEAKETLDQVFEYLNML